MVHIQAHARFVIASRVEHTGREGKIACSHRHSQQRPRWPLQLTLRAKLLHARAAVEDNLCQIDEASSEQIDAHFTGACVFYVCAPRPASLKSPRPLQNNVEGSSCVVLAQNQPHPLLLPMFADARNLHGASRNLCHSNNPEALRFFRPHLHCSSMYSPSLAC